MAATQLARAVGWTQQPTLPHLLDNSFRDESDRVGVGPRLTKSK